MHSSVPVMAVQQKSALLIATDERVLKDIRNGYLSDEFCKKFVSGEKILPNVREVNGLWYIGDRLLIPHTGNIREQLFRLAHDSLGHFGADKAYGSLRDAYYWPNMRCDLELSYIPSCEPCQRNKSRTSKIPGPLHPLPVPEKRGESVAIDFIGPLPEDGGFNCIATFTDRIGADVRIVPCKTTLTAEGMAQLFFDSWYCENGLPLEIISDRDKLFISKFWRALHKLTGVRLALSSSFHPETDGASERSNKTINQSIRYHVDCAQKGWVAALPRIRFNMMNTINASTGFSGFNLHLGRSPRVIPPLVPSSFAPGVPPNDIRAAELIEKLLNDTCEASDNLIRAKVNQAHQANRHRSADFCPIVGDRVLLNTFHRCRDYAQGALVVWQNSCPDLTVLI